VLPAAWGKLDDPTINALKTGALTDPAFRLKCGSVTGYFAKACNFAATTPAAADCNQMATTLGGPYGASAAAVSNWFGLADGTGATLIYGSPSGTSYYGCYTGAWGGNGTLWVR
jgi:hypothetical protein